MSEPDERVADDDRPIGVDRGEARPARKPWLRSPAASAPDRGRDVAGEVVPGEGRRPARVRGRLAEGRLLDGEERPDLVAGRADHPDRRGEDQERDPARDREDDARRRSSAASRRSGRAAGRSGRRCVVSHREMSVSPIRVRVRISADRRARRGRAPRGTGRGRRRGTRSRTSGATRVRKRSRPLRSRPRRLAARPASRGSATGVGVTPEVYVRECRSEVSRRHEHDPDEPRAQRQTSWSTPLRRMEPTARPPVTVPTSTATPRRRSGRSTSGVGRARPRDRRRPPRGALPRDHDQPHGDRHPLRSPDPAARPQPPAAPRPGGARRRRGRIVRRAAIAHASATRMQGHRA